MMSALRILGSLYAYASVAAFAYFLLIATR